MIYFSTCVSFKLFAENCISTELYWVHKDYEEGAFAEENTFWGVGIDRIGVLPFKKYFSLKNIAEYNTCQWSMQDSAGSIYIF